MGSLGGLQSWVAGLAFLVATIIAIYGGIKYGPKGEWGNFWKVVGIALVVMVITGGAFLQTVQDAGGKVGTEVITKV